MRAALIALGLAGALLFGALCALSFVQPLWVEQAAREIVRIEVERRTGERIERLTNERLFVLGQKALGRTYAQIEAERRRLVEGVPARVAGIVADMLSADCECRKRLQQRATDWQREHIRSLEALRARLSAMVESAYRDVREHLLRELRIVSAANALMFALVAAIAWRRRGVALQLLLPALVLLGAAALTAGVYLFKQDWLHTIVFGRYVGWAYVAWLAAAVALLADIVLNRARVTTRLVNAAAQVVGATVHVAPC